MRTAALGLILCVLGTCARAQGGVPEDIKDLFKKYSAALTNKNLKGIQALEAPHFYAVEDGKKVPGTAFAPQILRTMAKAGKMRFVTVVPIQVDSKGGGTHILAIYRFEAEMPNTVGPKHPKPSVQAELGRIQCALEKSAGGWKFSSLEQTKQQVMVDGRSISGGNGR
jgi:hypothetical protein